MYHYGFTPQASYTIMYLHKNSHIPYSSGRLTETNNGFVLPPIQMHNFSSRPFTYYPENYSNGHIEYHHFYGVNPFYKPNWWYPSYNPVPAYGNLMNYRNPQTIHKPVANTWPEGFTMKGELQWGKLERVFGLKRELPDFVKDDLRRVYGTYPRTFVAITYQNGEYLVKGDPKVGEQEYTVEKKVIRKPPTPTDSEEEDSSDSNQKKRRRKPKR
ncbi:uncharacterized protein C10orf95 homolog [Bombina bombina]|uniref:uncharacterized protein C10orf95 homolog n=1 Tax=Bombina bombina TaxID=8345 RepID=UPI00235AF578|nr:uncharacterized protein C10orf95 homolog [Bombina bombina]